MVFDLFILILLSNDPHRLAILTLPGLRTQHGSCSEARQWQSRGGDGRLISNVSNIITALNMVNISNILLLAFCASTSANKIDPMGDRKLAFSMSGRKLARLHRALESSPLAVPAGGDVDVSASHETISIAPNKENGDTVLGKVTLSGEGTTVDIGRKLAFSMSGRKLARLHRALVHVPFDVDMD